MSTPSELDEFLATVKIHNKDLNVCFSDAVAETWLKTLILKHYIKRTEVEAAIPREKPADTITNDAHAEGFVHGYNAAVTSIRQKLKGGE